jgi:MFS family permease
MAKTGAVFYGWTIVGVSFVTLAISFGIWYSFSVFFVAILSDFGGSHASIAGIFSVFIFVHSAAALIVGPLMDRFGPRLVIPVGSAVTSLGLILTSRVDTLWQFYAAYGILTAAGLCTTGFISHSIFLPRWFDKRRGFALGIAMAGAGLGMLVFVPLSEWLISSSGWRTAYCTLAGVVMIVVIPLNIVFQRRSPIEVGDIPDGRRSLSGESLRSSFWEGSPLEFIGQERRLTTILKYDRFWFLLFAYFVTPLVTQGPLVHQVAHMVDRGYSPRTGAFIFGLTGITGSFGKVLFGYFSDQVGRERALAAGMTCAFLGIFSLMLMERGDMIFPYAYAFLFGLGYGSVAPIYPSRAAELFEGPQFGRVVSFLSIASGIGGGFGTWLYGKIYDITASYKVSFITILFTTVLVVIAFWFTSPVLPARVRGGAP